MIFDLGYLLFDLVAGVIFLTAARKEALREFAAAMGETGNDNLKSGIFGKKKK